jgi:hypothetical protein
LGKITIGICWIPRSQRIDNIPFLDRNVLVKWTKKF